MMIFNVRNQNISRIDNFSPTEKSENYLEAQFNFKTDDWQGVTKTAVFENAKAKVIKDVILVNDKCLVPWEVLEGNSAIKVSVYGVSLSEKITTDIAEFKLNSTLHGGSATTEPTPDVYQQIINMIENIEAGDVPEEQIAKAVDKYLAEHPVETLTKEDVQNIVSTYVTEHKEELKGEKGDKGDPGTPGSDGLDGADGFSPIATVERNASDTGAVITITDKNGTTSVEVKDGIGGEGGNTESVNEVTKTAIVGTYNTSNFLGETFNITPVSKSYVASKNFLKFESAGAGVENPLTIGETANIGGVDITLNEDGTVTLNGEATSNFYIYSNLDDDFRTAIIGYAVKLSYFKSDSTSLTFASGIVFNDASYSYNLTSQGNYSGKATGEMMTGKTRLNVTSGTLFNNLTVSAMLEISSESGFLSDYENSDCITISESTDFDISDYTTVSVVGEHTVKYMSTSSVIDDDIKALKESNPLYGKKIACIGDSLCYGAGFLGGYCSILTEFEPNAMFVNKGVGGARISSNHENGGNWWIQNQLEDLSDDINYIAAEGYVNDYLTNCELGELSDGYEAELDTTKFYGGMESLLKIMVNNYADKRCGFIITHSHYSVGALYENELYLKAIRECCDKWGVPYLDLSNLITSIIPINNSTFYTDGIHYNELGYRRITNAIREWLKTL